MADEQTPKKVVKRVVKKPVAPPSQPSQPTMRYGRPVSGSATKVAARDEPAAAPPSAGPGSTGLKRPSIKAPSIKAPKVNVKPALDAVTSRTSSAASAIGSRAGQAGRATGRFASDRWSQMRAWRVPQLEPLRAAPITGLLVGVVSVGLGIIALLIFSEVRGVASGGGTWGSLTFVAVAFVAFALGERLLIAFGTPMARLTSFLGVMLTIIVILGVLLDVADSRYGLVVVPVLSAAAFFGAHWVLARAEASAADLG